jgi:hypothetical protein
MSNMRTTSALYVYVYVYVLENITRVYVYVYVYVYEYMYVHVQENIINKPHAHDISADILPVWLRGFTLQQ